MGSNADIPDWITLTDGETVVWEGHRTLHRITSSVVAGLVVVASGVAFALILEIEAIPPWVEGIPPWLAVVPSWLPLVLVPIGLLVIAWAYVKHASTRYVITTEEVYRKTGLFDRDVAQIRLGRIQNTAVSQSFRQRVLSYGDVTVYTAGSDTLDIVLDDVPKPGRVNRVLTEGIDATMSGDNGRGVTLPNPPTAETEHPDTRRRR